MIQNFVLLLFFFDNKKLLQFVPFDTFYSR